MAINNNIARVLIKDKFAYYTIIAAIFVSGIVLTAWLVLREDRLLRQSLLRESEILSQAIDVEYVSQLKGDSTDLQNPYYHLLKKQFAAVANANSRYYFVYLLGQKSSGEVFFYVDNELEGSKDESIAGQVYEEASEELLDVFSLGISNTEGPIVDRWGTFISSMVPLFQRGSAKPVAVLGIDIDARLRVKQMVQAAVPPSLLTLTLLSLIIFASALMKKRERQGVNAPLWMQYIESELVLVVGLVVTLFIALLSYQKSQRDIQGNFSKLAETRTYAVSEAIREIRYSRLEGLAGFFTSNDLVRLDEFEKYSDYLLKNNNVVAWNWVSIVRHENLDVFQEGLKKAGITDFVIWEFDEYGKRIPARQKPVYYPVTLMTKGRGNEVVIGFDQNSDSIRAAACREALSSPENVACTPPVQLVQDTSAHPGLIVYRPVYEDKDHQSLKGFAVAVLDVGMLLKSSFSEMMRSNAVISLVNIDGTLQKLHHFSNDHVVDTHNFSFTRHMFAFGRVFTITVFSEVKPLTYAGYRSVWITLISGLALTLSFAFVLWFFVRTRFKLERLVEERTARLRDSEARFRQVAEQLSELIVIVNRRGVVEYASPASVRVVGLKPDELIGQYYISFLDPTEVKVSLKAFFGLYNNHKKVMNLELKMNKADGTPFDGEIAGTPFKLNNEDAILLTIRDISNRKHAQEEILKAKERAEISDKLKTRFLVNISHEIRTPMNGVMGFLDLLKDMDLSREERSMYISFVNKSGHRLMDTINDIIEMSKIETGQLTIERELVDIAHMLDYLHEFFKPLADEKKLKIQMEPLSPELAKAILTDKSKLQSILHNIIKNAVKFTNTGSIRIGCFAEGKEVVFFVRDTGIGIPADRLDAIFDRFVQADITLSRPYEGAGLGLSIARAFVEVLGGSIRVESEVGQGSVFFVRLPVILA